MQYLHPLISMFLTISKRRQILENSKVCLLLSLGGCDTVPLFMICFASSAHRTVTAQVYSCSPICAVTSAVPAALAVSVPSEATDTTPVSEDVQNSGFILVPESFNLLDLPVFILYPFYICL